MPGSLTKILVLISASLISMAVPCILSADEQVLENPRIVIPENLGEMPNSGPGRNPM